MKPLPLQPMCPTCPFRPGSKYADLAPMLTQAALESTRICHSTGSNAIHRRTGKPPAACAGARKVALEAIAGMGIISAPTEEAWQAECDRRGLRNGVVYDPQMPIDTARLMRDDAPIARSVCRAPKTPGAFWATVIAANFDGGNFFTNGPSHTTQRRQS